MKVTFVKQNGYGDFVGLQFVSVDRTRNVMVKKPQKCKEIFAYEYRGSVGVIKKRFRYLITLTGGIRILNAETTQDFLNQIEQEMGFSKSRVWNVTGSAPEGTQALLIDSSAKWLRSSPLFHLLLLLARNGSKHELGKGWKATLAKFRRTGDTFQVTDFPQFLITREAIPHIVARKGNLETLIANADGTYRISKAMSWQPGIGICTWAEQIKEAGII